MIVELVTGLVLWFLFVNLLFQQRSLFMMMLVVLIIIILIVVFGIVRVEPNYNPPQFKIFPTTYTINQVVKTPCPKGAQDIDLIPRGWKTAFRYCVDCSRICGGCPDVWPNKFKVIDDGAALVIVPIHQKEKETPPQGGIR